MPSMKNPVAVIGVVALVVLVAAFSAFVSMRVGRNNPTPAEIERADAAAASKMAEAAASQAAKYAPPPEPVVTVARPKGRALRTMFIGDSLNFGLFASKDAAGFRPRMVAAWEKGGPVESVKAEKVGGTTGRVTFENRRLSARGMDVIVVELGTNDAGGQTPLPRFHREYRALLQRLRSEAPKAAMVCAGTWRDSSAGSDYDPVIQRECARVEGAYRPLVDLFEDSTNKGPAGRKTYGGISDDFHPNDTGYAKIAGRLLGAVEIR